MLSRMMKSCTVFLIGILLLQSCVTLSAILSNVTDQLALLAFKSQIQFDPSSILAHNWSTETSFCNWVGVSCSKSRQRVTALQLPNMGLQGTISSYIGNLSFLTWLDLSNNSFHGFLPSEFGHLRRLQGLRLGHSQLEGSIPSSLSMCRTLQVIELVQNNFTGAIPEELGILPKLEALLLGSNHLSGLIPPSIGNITTLTDLGLEYNSLTGSVPFIIFNLTSVRTIFINDNALSGTLPQDICRNCRNLQKLIVERNQLGGNIPSIDRCRELRQTTLAFNRFTGSIPTGIGTLPALQILYLGKNTLTGTIPPSLGNISTLQDLFIGSNYFEGTIPPELGRLSNLVELSIENSGLTGAIPEEIFNISSLQIITLSFNALSGALPLTAGLRLPDLQVLNLQVNYIGGYIPLYLSNSSKLVALNLENNSFVGPIPTNLGNLRLLQVLNVQANKLSRDQENAELSFLTSLSNCGSLRVLVIQHNPLNGIMPVSMGNSTSPLQSFAAAGCQIHGNIPTGIGSFKKLITLDLSSNRLNGTIPPSMGGLQSLQRVYLESNKLEGFIPDELCQLTNLGVLSIYGNGLSGPIPDCIGNITRLQQIYLSSNRLTSIPVSLWSLQNLVFLNLSSNSLSSNLPPNVKLGSIENLDLSINQIPGTIPSDIGDFQKLISLNLSRNSLQGPIPESLGKLVALDFLDLSYNNLTGAIPQTLEALRYLRQLNVSFNKLSGTIPTGGPFANFTASSFLGNAALCGNSSLQVSPCETQKKKDKKLSSLKFVLPAIAFLVLLVASVVTIRRYRKSKAPVPDAAALLPDVDHRLVSYNELRRATDRFSEANLLGVGSVGSVYRGVLADGTVIAVKVLNMQLESAFKSFEAECAVLRKVRHRNLVKVISSCSSPEFRALILQYMSNGSLEKWLYSHNNFLNLIQRVSILADISTGLEYLHHGQTEQVVHCDLKPSNVLLDDELVAHVGDFGISRILGQDKNMTQTKTLGTIGYMAPEYGSEGLVSRKGDIYCFGIIVLETMTRKKPTDEMFAEDMSLRQWVLSHFPDTMMKVIDHNLLEMEGGTAVAIETILLAIMEIGLDCSRELPEERPDMKDIVNKLSKIKQQIL